MPDEIDVDPALKDLFNLGKEEAGEIERTLTPWEIHRCGLELHAQGYAAQAQTCFKLARRIAFAEHQVSLGTVATIDLSRSLNGRNPRLALNVLGQIKPEELSESLRCKFYNEVARAAASLCKFKLADRYYQSSLASASENNDVGRMAIAMANRSMLLFENGAHPEAGRLNTEALAMLSDSAQGGNVGLLLANMATNAMHVGHYDEASDYFERLFEFCRDTKNVEVCAYTYINGGEFELLAGNLESAHELFRRAEKDAIVASLPVVQAQALILKAVIEETLEPSALLETTASCARDLHARELPHQSAPLAVLAACLAESQGHSAEPYLSILDSVLASLDQTRVLLRHYRRVLSVLEEKRRADPVRPFPRFITQAPAIITIKDRLGRLLGSDVRILIEGETGTGKSFLARQIHDGAGNSRSPFVIVDCTNLEENLFESKLFGHLRGSFTGATSDTVGLVEQANGGTLFLDEIGELPPEIQGKLLYTIEEQRYRPVGAKQERQSEFRLIAATNRDIDQMLDAGTLRRDLFFRLAGFRVTLPSLRERREDIVPLVALRLEQLNSKYRRKKSLRSDVWESLVQYPWPGNVRELNTALERGYHLSMTRRISLDDLALGLSSDSTTAEDLSWYSIRREHLLRVLKLCRGNVTKAAHMLGLNRTTLIYKLKLLDIDRRDFDPNPNRSSQKVEMRQSSDSEQAQGISPVTASRPRQLPEKQSERLASA